MTRSPGNLLAHARADRPGATDAELVAAFVTDRDEGAFAALVLRHGPMVLATCRRIVAPDTHAADDAFQAAFLVLATRAGTVHPPGRVGAWLYGVAVRVARRARSWVNRHPTTDPGDLAGVAGADPDPDVSALREAIDAVLVTLPEKYRAPVLLCDLEGRSRAEAAVALGWTEGTLSGRLARARRLLADRLARRGYAPALAATAVSALAQPARAVPEHLVAVVVRTAGLAAAGSPTGVPARVIELSQGVATMSSFGYRAVVAGVLLATGVALFSLAASDPPQPPPNPQNLPNLPSARAEPAEPGPRAGPSWVAGPGFSNRGRVTALAVGAEIVAVGDDQGHLLFWNVKTGKRVETLHQGSDGGEQETIDDLAISRDGKQFSYILNRGGGMHQASVQAKGRDYSGFAISGKWAYYGATGDSRHWLGRETAKRELLLLTNNHAQGKFEEAVVSRFPHPDKVTHAAGDAGIVASVSGLEKATLRGWQAGNEKALWEVDLGGADVTGVLVSPGGKRVAVTGDAGLVRVFDAATGKPVSKAGGLTGTISAAAFDRDGKWLVVGCRDGAARVVDAESGEVLTTLRGHEDRVLAVAVGPDGTIATGAADKLVKVWQPRK